MKNLLALICLVFVFLTAGCDSIVGPGPITPIVTGEGTYERVYAITHPEEDQPVQIVFEKQDNGAWVVNTSQISDNSYSFVCRELYATYPSGAVYKMYAADYKIEIIPVGKKFTLNGYEFQGGDKGYVLFRLDKDGTVYELFD